jgi:TonB family protein
MTFLLSVAARQAVLLLGALAATTLLRRQSAAVRHWMLAVAVGGAVTMPALEAVSPRWQLATAVPRATQALVLTPSEPGREAADVRVTPEERTAPPPAAAWTVWRARTIAAATTIWLAGVAFGLVALGFSIARLVRVARAARHVTHGPMRARTDEIARRLGVRRPVTLLESDESTFAFTWGLLHPQIVLPTSAAADWTPSRLAVVLQHELAHVARWDWAIQLAAAIGRAVWWFNPLVWTACRQLRHESELAADDIVLRGGVDGAEYASHLVEIARQAAEARELPAPAIVHRSTLEGRIRAMLNDDLDRRPLTTRTRLLALTCGLVVALSIAGVAAREAGEAAQAAAPPSSISGTVYDQAGGLLPGVSVALVHAQTTGRYETLTDPRGAFSFRNLPPGDYELITTLPGFNTVKNLLRVGAAPVKRYVTLPLGAIEETITVTPDPPGAKPRAPIRMSREIPEPKVPGPCTGAIGGCIKVPQKTATVSPVYPSNLAATGRGGTVEITGRIGIDGYMADMRVRDNAGENPELQAAALEAVSQWEFEPTRLNNAPVETNITVHVYFSPK